MQLNDEYYQKYLKYKSKYMQLKEQKGGAQPYFGNNTTILYIMAFINPNSNIYNLFQNRVSHIVGSNINNPLHATLLTLHINNTHPIIRNYDVFKDRNFLDEVKNVYKQIFANLELESVSGNYDLFGASNNFFNIDKNPNSPNNIVNITKNKLSKFFVRRYKLPQMNEKAITTFRISYYKLVNKYLNMYDGTNNKIILFENSNLKKNAKLSKPLPVDIGAVVEYNGHELYAVDVHYFGTAIWEPHISLFSNVDFFNKNQQEYGNLQQKSLMKHQYPSEIKVFQEKLLTTNFGGKVNKIHLTKDINKLVFSYFDLSQSNKKIARSNIDISL
ncbi:hypothetical protein Catovirus_1_370 [Catovirus CTV1]|uniref:Uncharacterized protein n=1 Tax=Catovirus CTV1 TaxID=1977631 RepID=A0A1V0S9C6_9VIRU|nr:hypothetical protein Catovirus_1_370 [Catovirus CTV1]